MASFFIWHQSHIGNPRASAVFLQLLLGLKWEHRRGAEQKFWLQNDHLSHQNLLLSLKITWYAALCSLYKLPIDTSLSFINKSRRWSFLMPVFMHLTTLNTCNLSMSALVRGNTQASHEVPASPDISLINDWLINSEMLLAFLIKRETDCLDRYKISFCFETSSFHLTGANRPHFNFIMWLWALISIALTPLCSEEHIKILHHTFKYPGR